MAEFWGSLQFNAPHNDGKNDVLKAIPVGMKSFSFFAIYNRWGQRVFYTTYQQKGLDGLLL